MTHTDYKARQAARNVAASALAATHPHLVPVWASKGGSLTAAATNLRRELKAVFPGVKFSVKTDRFSGGDQIACRRTWCLSRPLPAPVSPT